MHVSGYLKEVRDFFKAENANELRILSNRAIMDAAVHNDREVAEVAVISYALSKLLQKTHFKRGKKWKEYKEMILDALERAVEGRDGEVGRLMGEVVERIEEVDKRDGRYVKGIVYKARAKKATEVYALGFSLSKACELTGAPKSEVHDYIGATRIHDEDAHGIGIRERVEELKRRLMG